MLKRHVLAIVAFAALAGAAPSSAQVPNIGGAVGGIVDQAPLNEVQSTTQSLTQSSVSELRNVRRNALRELRQRNRDVIDVDDAGALVVRNEIVAVAPTEAALAAARARGFSVRESVDATALGLNVVVLVAPEGLSTRRALEAVRAGDPGGAYDYNHLYFGADAQRPARRTLQRAESVGGSGSAARLGLIDSGVEAGHPTFAGASIQQHSFVGRQPLADTHGTEVASLLVGADGAAPRASLYVADVYGGRPTGGGATAIVAAMAWLVQSRAAVINISLVGPPNRALEAAVRAAIARGHVIVAAVGNDGPSAPPLYPAAYSGVIGVTGVDGRNRVLPEAGRGQQVDFAAPGVEINAAALGGAYAPVRGTSFAAPIVAGLLARRLDAPSVAGAARAQATLAHDAVDLGARGPDRIFGAGLIGEEMRITTRRLARR